LHYATTTQERLAYAIDDRFYGLEESHLTRFRRLMDQVTRDETNAAVKKHLQYENLQIVIVTKDAQRFKDALVADKPSPIQYPTPKPQAVLDEDREISSFPLRIRPDHVRIVPLKEVFAK
jgi:zinc protease